MAKTIHYRVYGAEGHRNAVSFFPSALWDFSFRDDIRILDIRCADLTGTNDYVDVIITRNTAAECRKEIRGQITDGLFENYRTGKVEVIA